jgi:hypothetical protein
MNFKQMMMDKIKANVANKVANNSNLINEVAGIVLDDLDYIEIAADLDICSSDIADEIDHADVISEITGHLDMDDIARAVADTCDLDEISRKVIANLPCDFMDDLAVQVADEIVSEMK